MRIEEVRSLRGFTVEWEEEDRLLLTRRNAVFESDASGRNRRRLGRVPEPLWRRVAARSRAAQRALRMIAYSVMPLAPDRYFVAFRRQIGILEGGRFRPLQGRMMQTKILRGAVARDPTGTLWFGDYLRNKDRSVDLHVYRLEPGSTRVEVVHTFARGSTKHIHGVYWDPYDEALWCLTGDLEHESRVLRSRDGFRTVEVVGEGDESWRCVSLRFTPDAVFWGTDAQFVRNGLFRWDRASGERTRLGDVDGPVFYSRTVDGVHYFGVTAETCPSQQGKAATIWAVDEDLTPRPIWSRDRDILPWAYFMSGTLLFPSGPGGTGGLLFSPLGVAGHDMRTYRVTRSEEAGAERRFC